MSDSEPPAPARTGAAPAQGWQEMPLPDQVAEWERLLPGSAERILQQVERNYEHERAMDRIDVRFRVAGMSVAGAGLAGILWVAKYVVDHGQALAGASLLGSGIVALTGVLIAKRVREK